jgi:hypothetical protein
MQFLPKNWIPDFGVHSYALGLVVMAGLAFIMIKFPLGAAGNPEDPPPPAAMM